MTATPESEPAPPIPETPSESEVPAPAETSPGQPEEQPHLAGSIEEAQPELIADERSWMPPILGEQSTLGRGFWAGPRFPWPVLSDFHSRDLDLDLGVVGNLCALGASTRGGSHRYQGTERQDAFSLSQSTPAGRFLIVAIADGLSSARQSATTARFLVDQTAMRLRHSLESLDSSDPARLRDEMRKTIMHFLGHATRKLRQMKLSGLADTDIASTLTWAILPTDGSEPSTVLFGGVGDSSVWKITAGRWQRQTTTADEELISPATAAIPVHDPERAAWFGETTLDADDVFALTTDGVANALGDGTTQVAAFLADKWRTPPEPLAFLADLQFDRKSFDDDRTAVLVWKRPQ